ncbi:hypothetical protein GCM10022220_36000 [Actinocatenispora rupis]|uniref:Uncharacterized protein n=1 Tax=Actinocatenispora rupis TaxID=519421 RepID=A0A8J3NCY8_9ACTN|nr:hypothetical protein Aru02nite_31960 [Actinocatenispora rupis]
MDVHRPFRYAGPDRTRSPRGAETLAATPVSREPLKVAAPKRDRQARYEEEAKAAGGLTDAGKPEAKTEKKRCRRSTGRG